MSFTTIAATTLGLADGDQSPTPVSGTVRITPRHPAGTTTSGGVIATGPVIVTITNGTFPITEVPAREDSTALVEFHLYTADGPVRMPDTEIPLAPGATINLRDYLPAGVDPATGAMLVRGAPGPGISEITATDTGIQIRMEDGTTTVLDGLTRAPGTPIFPTQAEAAAWERDNPGGVAIWVDGAPDPIGPDDGLLPIWFSARTGLPPVGWTARFNTSAKTATLADGGYMRLAHNQAMRWALTHDATGNVGAPLDVVMKMRGTRTSTGGFSFGIIVGQSGSVGTETGTAAYFNYGSGQSPLFRLMEYVDGTASTPLTAPAPDFTEWTWMRLNVGDDGWTRVRVWSDSEDEPDGWTQSTSRLATNPGRIGIFNAGNADADIAYVNVSTDGTPARIVGA